MSDAPPDLAAAAAVPRSRHVASGARAAGASAPDLEVQVRATAARALDAVVRARALADRLQETVTRARALVADREDVRDEVAATREALCAAAGGLAARLRREGVPPERMLVLLKTAVREGAPLSADVLAAQALMSEAVRCGIRAYYAAA